MDFSKAQPGDDDLGDDSWGEEDDDWGEAEPTVATNNVTGAAAVGKAADVVEQQKPKLNPFGGKRNANAINVYD